MVSPLIAVIGLIATGLGAIVGARAVRCGTEKSAEAVRRQVRALPWFQLGSWGIRAPSRFATSSVASLSRLVNQSRGNARSVASAPGSLYLHTPQSPMCCGSLTAELAIRLNG
ncbi:hypothetical protein ABZ858_00530 [Streptomyces sp. NPDC047017]|uniref:hypothetical protein n=1 Tax=Streptomyces sp. NPDC047017 TaxID=3155024 RepID=UPI0033C66C0B